MESVLTTSVTAGESEFISSLVSRSHPLHRHFPNLNGHRNHLVILSRCRFWLRRSRGWGLRVCTFNTPPNAAVPAAGNRGTSVTTTALFGTPREFRILGTPRPYSYKELILWKTCSLRKTANSIMCRIALILGFSLLGCFNFLGAYDRAVKTSVNV